eukprot:151210_1
MGNSNGKQKQIVANAATLKEGFIVPRKISSKHYPNDNTFIPEPSIAKESYQMLKTSIQISLCMIFEVCVETVSAIFFGHLPDSSQILSATTISKSFLNITVTCIAWGFSCALYTLLPQAIGSNNSHLIRLYFQRGMLVCMAIAIPLTICVIFYTKNMLIFIGVNSDNDISWTMITNYCIALIPFVYIMIALSIIHRIAQNLNYNFEVFIIQAVVFFFSIPLNYLLIIVFNFGYIGGALVTDITYLISVIFMILLLINKGHGYVFKPLPLHQICDYKGLYQYIQLGFPGAVQSFLTWSLREFVVILTGFVSNLNVAAPCTAIMRQINLITLMHNGMANAFTIRIGNYIGGNLIIYAKRCMKIQLCFGVILFVLIASVYICFKSEIATAFTNDIEVVELLRNKLIYVCVFDQFNIAIHRNVQGIYRALGYQKLSANCGIIMQYFVALPLQLYLLFSYKYYDNMEMAICIIWLGTSFGRLLTHISLIFMLKYYIDWDKAVSESELRIKQNNETILCKERAK